LSWVWRVAVNRLGIKHFARLGEFERQSLGLQFVADWRAAVKAGSIADVTTRAAGDFNA
jgi:hypothetical protein